MSSNTTIFTVSQITAEIKQILEKKYRFIRITGEISNLKTPVSGHSYFTLKDSGAQIQAVLFKNKKRFLSTNIKDGQEVLCFGQINVYEPRGNYQLIVDSIEPAGEGRLRQQFDRLKMRLEAKGYFATEKKKKIPATPRTIAVVSSPTSAACADFLKIIAKRESSAHIRIYPVRVQGNGAAAEIAAAIEKLNAMRRHDVIVLIRGGGSLEDLWAFNEEIIADAIFSSELPIVTGIGHETDYTIADFCADYRCPTPTATAELLSSDKSALRRRLHAAKQRLGYIMKLMLLHTEQRLQRSTQKMGEVEAHIVSAQQRLEISRSLLLQAIAERIGAEETRLAMLSHKLQLLSPAAEISRRVERLYRVQQHFTAAMQQHVSSKENLLAHNATLLHSVSPLATLARGYSIVRKKDDAHSIVKCASEITSGEQVEVLLHQGRLLCLIEESRNQKTMQSPK